MMGCFAAGAVLVSFGVVIGKVSPLQLLALTMIEVPVYFANMHIGVDIIQAVDAGKSPQHFLGVCLRTWKLIFKMTQV